MHDVPELVLSDDERVALRTWAAERPDRLVRARIVLDAAAGLSVSDSARALGVSRPTVSSWRNRYAAHGLAGLAHRPRSGRPPRIDEADVVAATLAGPPPPRRAWSARALADHLGLSHTAVSGVWRRWAVTGEGPPAVTLPAEPAFTVRRPLLLGLWQRGRSAAIVLAEPSEKPPAPGAAPAEERVSRAAALSSALTRAAGPGAPGGAGGAPGDAAGAGPASTGPGGGAPGGRG
ncbi:helix-turn-helix domain-containing protein, partial [Streptomyces sp. SBT349]|uniref:helix-turn-helix domain-containing protein n=1 Tax=Streptomyces sp. SBT349 TaxID=1580539 RepID=UPI00066E1E85